MNDLVELCRRRAQQAKTPRMKGWWTHEANRLEKDPSREGLVRRFFVNGDLDQPKRPTWVGTNR